MDFKYRPDEMEIKLMLLYIIKNLKVEVTYTLLDYTIKDLAELNYFELKHYIDALTSTSAVKELETGDGNLIYTITNTGEETVDFFSDKLPFTIRETLNERIRHINKVHNTANEIKVDYYPVCCDEYAVKFEITENNIPMLKLEFYAGSRERAKELAMYINENPDTAYAELFECINKLKK